MGRKVACDDNFFFDNGYWVLKTCESKVTKYNPEGGWKYDYVIPTEKWRKLMDTIFRTHDLKQLITPEILIKTIEGKTSRTPRKKNSGYKKIVRPEGYLTIKQRKEKAKRIKAKKNANTNT